jgi:hypothetical protein
MMYGGMLAELAKQAAAEEFARRVAAEREGAVNGTGGEYSVGGYQSEIPNPATESVSVRFNEPGLEAPVIDPVDIIAGGVAGKVGSSVARKAAVRQFADAVDPKWNRTTRVTPEYGGATAGAIVDGNPYLRTEPSKKLRAVSGGKGSWVNEAFPYSASEKSNNPMRDELADRLYDARFNDQISGETVRSLMDMMYGEWR